MTENYSRTVSCSERIPPSGRVGTVRAANNEWRRRRRRRRRKIVRRRRRRRRRLGSFMVRPRETGCARGRVPPGARGPRSSGPPPNASRAPRTPLRPFSLMGTPNTGAACSSGTRTHMINKKKIQKKRVHRKLRRLRPKRTHYYVHTSFCTRL